MAAAVAFGLASLPSGLAATEPFSARFSNARGNEWWVEVDVAADQPVAGVAFRVEDQGPQPLERTSWGSWARSYPVYDGTVVRFVATSETGETVSSGCYRWVSAQPVSCDQPKPVTFDYYPKGNEWWVEATVLSQEPVTSVSVSLNGAAPVPLSKTSWGTWAKSYHAPEGTLVKFFATSQSGATGKSGCYRWVSATLVECPDYVRIIFDPKGGNEWWVEVFTSGTSADRVQAMDTDGAWVELSKRSWGNWAASFHIEPGHQVKFRAEAKGNWYESCWFTHPQGISPTGGPTCAAGTT